MTHNSLERPMTHQNRTTRRAAKLSGLAALLFIGAIFGFFYAWVVSTLWGLDEMDPRGAIAAMQAMNASVRNAAFFPAFFLTPLVLALAAGMAWRVKAGRAAVFFALAGAIYLCFGIGVTGIVNVPMNEALAATPVPADRATAAEIWSAYSVRWQGWNLFRTIASGVALLFTGLALYALASAEARSP